MNNPRELQQLPLEELTVNTGQPGSLLASNE